MLCELVDELTSKDLPQLYVSSSVDIEVLMSYALPVELEIFLQDFGQRCRVDVDSHIFLYLVSEVADGDQIYFGGNLCSDQVLDLSKLEA